MTIPSTEEIERLIRAAIETLYGKDRTLISDEAHEQTIAARIILHLQHLLPDWDVDVEFNRQGEKRETKVDATGTPRKPDIVVHKRGPKGPNLALVLVKCEWNTQPRADDLRVAQSIKQKQGYRAAFLLEITQAEFQLFKV